ncbi:MAG: glycoside hydrolase family 3 C-terminal domain-containing protein, partial [Bacilli bacterium]|nr:glycoside hydrolase family 3 C-terminal domain-containing protein [Bacilli bacterium]
MKRKTLLGVLALAAGGIALGIAAAAPASAVYAEDAAASLAKWYPDFQSEADQDEYSEKINNQIMEESVILLKNENDALPIARSEGVTLIGNGSYHFTAAGTGSGSGGGINVNLQTALRNNGIDVNKMAESFYGTVNNKVSLPIGMFGGSTTLDAQEDPAILKKIEGSYRNYKTFFWTLTRTGGEGADLPTQALPSTYVKDPTKHYLELNDNEVKMLAYLEGLKAAGAIDKLVVLVNSCNIIEMGPLQDSAAVDSILWVGQPGPDGLQGVANVLVGKASPSGRTVDVWTRDHTLDPVWQNFGTNNQHAGIQKDDDGNIVYGRDGVTPNVDSTSPYYSNSVYVNNGSDDEPEYAQANGQTHTVEYEEGIYLGYKYFETAYADKTEGFDYDKAVCYPFGYGLSYTTFSQKIASTASEIAAAINGATSAEDTFELKVTVKNTGGVAGKEVVQIYNHAPYTKGGIEKAEISLVGFAKTKILKPGASQTVTVEIRVGDLASFDYNDANANDYKGYELEAGNYELRLMKNSHELIEALPVELTAKTTVLDNDDDATNNALFSNGDDFDSLLILKDEESKATMKTMSRTDLKATFPTAPKNSDKLYGDRLIALLPYNGANTPGANTNESRYLGAINGSDDKETDPWYKTNADIPSTWTQAASTDGRTGGKVEVMLAKMAGYDYFDTETIMPTGHPYAGKTAAEAWDLFMNQLTLAEMTSLLNSGQYMTPGLASVGKAQATDQDGPASLKGCYTFASATNIAATWNVELAYERGRATGNYSLFSGQSGWYAPSMNTHRSPFSGRNFEYYSQDGFLAGKIASQDVKGFQDKGGYAFIKHFAVNDQETDRMGTGTFATEQAIRENHMKTFEISVKEGGAKAVMTSFNRIGAIPASGNYMSINGILRGEWGFHGHIVTDYYMGPLAKGNMAIRAGAEMPLGRNNWGGIGGVWDAALRDGNGGVRFGNATDGVQPESPTQYYAIRVAALHVLWNGANTNNNLNLLDTSVFTNQTIAGKQGFSIGSQSFAPSAEVLGTDLNSYSISGNLPAGISFNAQTCTFSGTPTVAGTYNVTVNVVSDYWVKSSFRVTFNIANPLSISDANVVTVDEAIDLTV